jgi:hypothetical protein
MTRKRLLLLVPVLAGLFFATMAGGSGPVTGTGASAKANLSEAGKNIVAALTDPLSLFAARSPGGRGSGALLSTEPERTAALSNGPEERVLSEVRDRAPAAGPAADGLPGTDNSFLPDNAVFGAGPAMPAADGGYPDDNDFSGSPITGTPASATAPFDDYDDGPVYTGPLTSLLPPGGGGGLISGVPEPETWAVMVLGMLAAGVALRRRRPGQSGAARVACRAC